MKQQLFEFSVRTQGRGFHEISDEVQGLISDASISLGLATLHLQHTSASLLIQENADAEVRLDFERFFQRLVPDGDSLFHHTAEGADDMRQVASLFLQVFRSSSAFLDHGSILL